MSYHQSIHLNNTGFYTLVEINPFADSEKQLSEPLYDACMIKEHRPFQRFNDAYLKWFIKEYDEEEEPKNDFLNKNDEEKPKNDLLNKKRKCPFSVVHGG